MTLRAPLATIAALLFTLVACERAQPPEPISLPPARTTHSPIPEIGPLPIGVQRGMCLSHVWESAGVHGYGSADAMMSKRELVALGVDWVSLTPFGWQPDLHSRQVLYNPEIEAGASDHRLEAEVAQARSLDLKVMLKPHMHISPTEWRGHIEPAEGGWAAWFDSYGDFILHYARLAEHLGVESFVIGLELASSSWTQEALWRALIEEIRAVYSGPLVYAANWNEAEHVLFWGAVDWIGIQFFPPLSDRDYPTHEALTSVIDGHLDSYAALSQRYDKPVILTEFGFKTTRRAADTPNIWPEHLPEASRQYDEHNQALAYTALLGAIGRRPFIKGVFVWKWFTDTDKASQMRLGFSPRGKKALSVLKRAYGAP